MVIHTPFYDPEKTFADNYTNGPFGAFMNDEIYTPKGEPTHDFFGYKIYTPIGIPAGPVPTANAAKAAFQKGFNIVIYKTVRTKEYPCHPFPNIIPVITKENLTLEDAKNGVIAKKENVYTTPIAITNSFGVPSVAPEKWQDDMKQAVQSAGKGQLLIGSFQATNRGEGKEAFIEDWKIAAQMVKETGVKMVEINFSCPNEGHASLLCHDTDMAEECLKAVKEELINIPVIVKMAYFPDQDKLEDFIIRLSKYADGFSPINTIAAAVRKEDGTQALPGEGRLVSGICGAPIKWAGVEMTKRIYAIRENISGKFLIIGCGGVMDVNDYKEYTEAGADAVMSATGAMWNPYLAKEIAEDVS